MEKSIQQSREGKHTPVFQKTIYERNFVFVKDHEKPSIKDLLLASTYSHDSLIENAEAKRKILYSFKESNLFPFVDEREFYNFRAHRTDEIYQTLVENLGEKFILVATKERIDSNSCHCCDGSMEYYASIDKKGSVNVVRVECGNSFENQWWYLSSLAPSDIEVILKQILSINPLFIDVLDVYDNPTLKNILSRL